MNDRSERQNNRHKVTTITLSHLFYLWLYNLFLTSQHKIYSYMVGLNSCRIKYQKGLGKNFDLFTLPFF